MRTKRIFSRMVGERRRLRWILAAAAAALAAGRRKGAPMRSRWTWIVLIAILGLTAYAGAVLAIPNPRAMSGPTDAHLPATPVIDWSNEARRAIVPSSAGAENFGNKFPGEAGVYMGIVHAAIYDAALAVGGGYEPYAIALHSFSGCLPWGGDRDGRAPRAHRNAARARLDAVSAGDPRRRLHRLPRRASRTAPQRRRGSPSASRSLLPCYRSARTTGGSRTPSSATFVPPPPGPGVWEPDPSRPVLGLRIPGIQPLALASRSQFRPDGPSSLTSSEYGDDFAQVKELGSADSTVRTRGADDRGALLDRSRRQAVERRAAPPGGRARARPRADGADAGDGPRRRGGRMIACFDAKYHYWFWRPVPGDPSGRHGRQPGNRGRSDVAAAPADAEPPRVPLGARVPHHRRRRRCSKPSSAPTRSGSRSTAASPARPASTRASMPRSKSSTTRASWPGSTFATPTRKARTSGGTSPATSPTTSSNHCDESGRGR